MHAAEAREALTRVRGRALGAAESDNTLGSQVDRLVYSYLPEHDMAERYGTCAIVGNRYVRAHDTRSRRHPGSCGADEHKLLSPTGSYTLPF